MAGPRVPARSPDRLLAGRVAERTKATVLKTVFAGLCAAGAVFSRKCHDGSRRYNVAGQRHNTSGGQPGALKSLTDPFTNAATTWTYDGAGRATGKTDAAGMTWTRSFELQSGALDTQQVLKAGKTYASFDLGYDGAGDVISRAEKLWRNGNPGSQSPDTGVAHGRGSK